MCAVAVLWVMAVLAVCAVAVLWLVTVLLLIVCAPVLLTEALTRAVFAWAKFFLRKLCIRRLWLCWADVWAVVGFAGAVVVVCCAGKVFV